MKDLSSHPIELVGEQKRFLDEMVSKYALADAGKAVRCLINYARENPEQHEVIFGEVRCIDC